MALVAVCYSLGLIVIEFRYLTRGFGKLSAGHKALLTA
jgi:hypothetical protein